MARQYTRNFDEARIEATAMEIRCEPEFSRIIRETCITTDADVLRAMKRLYGRWQRRGSKGLRPITSKPGQPAIALIHEAICNC